jgi:serine protease Do
LLDQFVRVRVINANALDLSRFEFDYDLSLSTLFFNADGTVYGRYGSWTHQRNPQERETAGLQRALEAVIQLHKGYPANQAALAGKEPKSSTFKSPLEIPALAGKYQRELNWDGKVVQSCVHCHQVGDAMRTALRDEKKPLPDELIYPWPAPETIGLTLAPDQVSRVTSVTPASPAAAAGFRAGDDIVSFGGQKLVSTADFSWVLHHAGDTASLPVVARRNGSEVSLKLELPAGWRSKAEMAGRVGTWGMRAMAFGGMVLEDLNDEERAKRGLGKDALGLRVKSVGQYGKHALAKNSGFQADDVLVEIDGVASRETEGQAIGRLLRNHLAGEKVKLGVLRGTQRVELSLAMQ